VTRRRIGAIRANTSCHQARKTPVLDTRQVELPPDSVASTDGMEPYSIELENDGKVICD
jgi:hypothetical protein